MDEGIQSYREETQGGQWGTWERASDSTLEPDTGRRMPREGARALSKATQDRVKTQMPTSHLWDTPPPHTHTQLHKWPAPSNLFFWLWEVRRQRKVPSSSGQDPIVPANREQFGVYPGNLNQVLISPGEPRTWVCASQAF